MHETVIWQGFDDVGSDAGVKLALDGAVDLGYISRDPKPAEKGSVEILSIGASGTGVGVNAGTQVDRNVVVAHDGLDAAALRSSGEGRGPAKQQDIGDRPARARGARGPGPRACLLDQRLGLGTAQRRLREPPPVPVRRTVAAFTER